MLVNCGLWNAGSISKIEIISLVLTIQVVYRTQISCKNGCDQIHSP